MESNDMLELARRLLDANPHPVDVDDAERLAELVIASGDWLLEIHRMLFPERYPREVQPDHVYWDGVDDPADAPECFEWTSETIEWVATMLERALAENPNARLEP